MIQCLDVIGEPYQVSEHGRLWQVRSESQVLITDSVGLSKSGVPTDPTIVICAGLSLLDVTMAEVEERGGSLLSAAKLTPAILFTHLFHVGRKLPRHGLEVHLASLLPRTECTAAVVRMFTEYPSSTLRVHELQLGLGITCAAANRLVRELGFHRAEHLCTYLRAEAWIWFIRRGLNRKVLERFLGIFDRSNFRRACHRACLDPPWCFPTTA